MIIIIYLIEELFFIMVNYHILDRLICFMGNLGILIALTFFSPLFIKYSCVLYKHQYISLIIIFILSLFHILFNNFTIVRFKKIFGLNFWYNLISFF